MFHLLSAYAPSTPNDPLLGDIDKPQDWLAGIGFLEILDVILVVGIVFSLFLYLFRRRAGKIIMGGMFVAALLWLCLLVKFPILSAFSQEVFSIFLLVLLILYHDEIRDILRQIGCFPEKIAAFITKKRGSGLSEPMRKAVKEICVAVEQMQASQTGALIVIRRANGLRDYTSKGTRLNAEVTDLLIRTIFYNGSPLHDGAVIIEKTKITAAACQLPPADPEGIDDSLGERHKAAIGISECTDAIAIVVSEETGTVSVALGDQLKRGYENNELELELTNLLANYNAKLIDWTSASSGKISGGTTSSLRNKKHEKEKRGAGKSDRG